MPAFARQYATAFAGKLESWLLAREALLLGGRDDLAVAHQAGGGVVVVRREYRGSSPSELVAVARRIDGLTLDARPSSDGRAVAHAAIERVAHASGGRCRRA